MAPRELTPEETFAGLKEAPAIDVKSRRFDADGNAEPTPEEFFAAETAKVGKGKKGKAAPVEVPELTDEEKAAAAAAEAEAEAEAAQAAANAEAEKAAADAAAADAAAAK